MDQAAEILCNLVCFTSKQPLVDFVSVPPIGHRSTVGGWSGIVNSYVSKAGRYSVQSPSMNGNSVRPGSVSETSVNRTFSLSDHHPSTPIQLGNSGMNFVGGNYPSKGLPSNNVEENRSIGVNGEITTGWSLGGNDQNKHFHLSPKARRPDHLLMPSFDGSQNNDLSPTTRNQTWGSSPHVHHSGGGLKNPSLSSSFSRVSSKVDADHVSSGANSGLNRVELSSSQDEGLKCLSFSNGMIPKRVVLLSRRNSSKCLMVLKNRYITNRSH